MRCLRDVQRGARRGSAFSGPHRGPTTSVRASHLVLTNQAGTEPAYRERGLRPQTRTPRPATARCVRPSAQRAVVAARWWYPRAQAPFAVRWLVACLAGVDEAMARAQKLVARDVGRRTRVPPALPQWLPHAQRTGAPQMTMPLMRPKRKNPVLRTRLPTLPPGQRGRVALGMTAAAAEGRFELQQCDDCGAVQYPPREACHRCLSPRAEVARTKRRRRAAQPDHAGPQQRPVLPRTPALAAGPGAARCRRHADAAPAWRRARCAGAREGRRGSRLRRPGGADRLSRQGDPHMADDPMLREMGCDPGSARCWSPTASPPSARRWCRRW